MSKPTLQAAIATMRALTASRFDSMDRAEYEEYQAAANLVCDAAQKVEDVLALARNAMPPAPQPNTRLAEPDELCPAIYGARRCTLVVGHHQFGGIEHIWEPAPTEPTGTPPRCDETLNEEGSTYRCIHQKGHKGTHENGEMEWWEDENALLKDGQKDANQADSNRGVGQTSGTQPHGASGNEKGKAEISAKPLRGTPAPCPLPAKWRAKVCEHDRYDFCEIERATCADELEVWLATRAQPKENK
jgi:hypothetical protein